MAEQFHDLAMGGLRKNIMSPGKESKSALTRDISDISLISTCGIHTDSPLCISSACYTPFNGKDISQKARQRHRLYRFV